MKPERPGIDGILLIDKPEGLTSAGVVARVKRLLAQRKVGHLGTLDPFATGLLPICLGEGTKLAQFLGDETKRYVGEIQLGSTTDTLDRTGTVLEERPVPPLATATIREAVATLSGDQLQIPPMYSALKQKGVPLYRLARAGQEVERAPRPVRISSFQVARIASDRLAFAVTCSRGTYVRSLARDLGERLGVGAHLATLRRTASGPFELADAVTLAGLPDADAAGRLPLVAPAAALSFLRAVVADAQTIDAIRHGRQRALRALDPPRTADETVRVQNAAGDLVAIAAAAPDATWRLARVMAPA